MSRLKISLVLLLLGFGAVVFWLSFSKNNSSQAPIPTANITSFEECMAAGFPVQESYPRGCIANGQHFMEEVDPEGENYKDLITVYSPSPGEIITSPLVVRGEARGNWYFEATFPVILTNWDGLIIAEGYAEAILNPDDPNSTWMTEEYVPFEAQLEFDNPSWEEEFSKRGSLILQKSNPSDLPENDDSFEFEVRFN